MDLNNARRATLKAAIDADGALSVLPRSTAAATTVANEMNKPSSTIVWKTSVTKAEVLEALAFATLHALSADQKASLAIYMAGEAIPCDRARVRGAFTALFPSGGDSTRLAALFKRAATRCEAVFATGGDGTDAAPHDLNPRVIGEITPPEIEAVRN